MAGLSLRDESFKGLTIVVPRPAPAWPLAICYIVFPLSNYLAELIGAGRWSNWIDAAWLLMGLYALVVTLLGHPRSRPALKIWPLFALCVLAMVWLALGPLTGWVPPVIAAMEAKPFIYLLIARVLTRSFALPSEQMFCRFGSMLAVILLVETILRSALVAAIVRPVGCGEVNYDAALLCLSLIFALTRRVLARNYGPLIFLGLVVSCSRTGLLAAFAVLLFTKSIPAILRVLFASCAVGGVIMSYAIRGIEFGGLEGMDRYWMWAVGLEYLVSHAWSHAVGVVPGAAVDVEVPGPLADLWLAQQKHLNIEGIFPFHFHGMWVRLAIGWGWAVAFLVFLWLAYQTLLRRFRPPYSKSYFIVCVVFGLTMGVWYLSNVGVPYLLALNMMLLEAKNRQQIARSRERVERMDMQSEFCLVSSFH